MWWNFVGRSHDDIATYRLLWEDRDARFGAVEGYRGVGRAAARSPAARTPRCGRDRIRRGRYDTNR